MRLIFATGNEGKLREAREILGPGCEVLGPADLGLDAEVEETGSTFRENSLIKAKYLFDRCGLPCFADDSGLEVDALGGAPGIYSARYASDHNFASNIDRLLAELAVLPPQEFALRAHPTTPSGHLPLQTFPSAARFRCVVTLMLSDGTPHFFDGSCEGRIATKRHGAGGFGYDPVFVPDAFPDRTIAELPEDVKNAISHRGDALRKMAEYLNCSNPE